ncbi:MAG: ATP-binding protein [Porticoccaceae bacterium]
MNLSIRLRLLLTASLTLGGFAILFPLSQIATFSNTLEEGELKRLAADARTVLAAAGVEKDRLVMPDAMENPRFNQLESDLIALIFDERGEVVWRSSSSRHFTPDYQPHYHRDEVVFTRLPMMDGAGDYFIHDWDVEVGDKTYSIVTGDRTTNFDSSLRTYQRQLRLWLIAGLGSLLVLLAGGLSWALRPLRRIYRQVIAVERGHMPRLEGEYPAELERLARGLNSLLAGERSRRKQYQTKVSDLAHGLKTPLAVISETCRNLPHDQRHILEDQVQRMNQLVNFHLQRAMAARPAWVITPLPLAPVLEKLCGSLDKVYHDKNIAWDVDIGATEVLVTEPEALEIFGNLLDNAFRLCLGRVQVSARAGEDSAIVRIEDDGPGVPENLRQRILERGGRADTQNAGQGIGLGLVVEMLAEMDGKLVIDDSVLGGAAFCVRLPAMAKAATSFLRH